MKTKKIEQEVEFRASPHEVYEALMDSKKHSGLTGSKCVVSREIRGKISCYDGYIEGRNLELVPDTKIVQEWRASEWPQGHYSRATFEFKKTSSGTMLRFTQTGVPEEFFDDIFSGWHEHYWEKMKEMLEA